MLFVLRCRSWDSFFGWFIVFWCCYVNGFRCRIWDLVAVFCNHPRRKEWELCCLLCLCFWCYLCFRYCSNVGLLLLFRWGCTAFVLFSCFYFLNFQVVIISFWWWFFVNRYCVVDIVLCFLMVIFSCCCCEFIVSFCFWSRFSPWFCCCISFVVVVIVSCCCCCCWFSFSLSLSESEWLSLFVFPSFCVG